MQQAEFEHRLSLNTRLLGQVHLLKPVEPILLSYLIGKDCTWRELKFPFSMKPRVCVTQASDTKLPTRLFKETPCNQDADV